VGKIALTADSTSHAIAVELTQRQPKTRVIAMGRPEDRKPLKVDALPRDMSRQAVSRFQLVRAFHYFKSIRETSKSQP
jgi:hypothetical protein